MRAAPGFMGRVARVPVDARAAVSAVRGVHRGVRRRRERVLGRVRSSSPGPPPPPSPGTSYSEGPILRTVVSVGIIAFALMALYGCWMRHRDDSVEMDRRRAERERHLDSALGEHLHLGQRESRRLARTELEKQERAERAEKEKQAAAASADVGGLGHGGASSVEMSEMSEEGYRRCRSGWWTCRRRMNGARGGRKSRRGSSARTTARRCLGSRAARGRRACSRRRCSHRPH